MTDLLKQLDDIAVSLALLETSDPDAAARWHAPLQQIHSWAQESAREQARDAANAALRLAHALAAPDADNGFQATLEAFGEAIGHLQEIVRTSHSEETRADAGPEMTESPLEEDLELVGEFVTEGREQLAESDEHLLGIEKNPRDDDALNAVFRCFHTLKGLAGFLQFPEIEELAHAAEDLLDKARMHERELVGASIDVIFETVDVLKALLGEIGASIGTGTPYVGNHDEVPRLIGRISALVNEAVPSEAAAVVESAAAVAQVETATEPAFASGSQGVGQASGDSIRVDADRLDRLVDMVGELVITKSLVSRASERTDGGTTRNLQQHMVRLDKIVRDLQELSGSLRMVPLRAVFRKMARLARDVGKKAGKSVDLRVSGEDAELDKSIVDRIGDPLVHLIRNAIDHGLEASSEERIQQGKPPAGRVQLRAFHHGGSIHIEVEDDGRGLNPTAILAKAIDRGLVQEGESLSQREILRLICAPGFSTAATISSISGRGVGMDVVKKGVEAMGGTLEIRSSLGKGSRFSMQLPLTLAVIDGMVIRLGSERFIIPTQSVVRLVTPDSEARATVLQKSELLLAQDGLIPILDLDRLLGVPRQDTNDPLAIVAEADGSRVGFMIDELVGQQLAVIKSLGDGLGETPGVAGCAILPDGRVGLVLDVGGLLRLQNKSAAPAPGAALRGAA